MGQDDDAQGDGPTENNYYLDQCETAEQTIETVSSDIVGTGQPASSIASAVSGGGWVCTVADEWVAELTQRCGYIETAFDEAATAVGNAKQGETERVPKDDPHGKAFKNSWGYRSAMSLRD